MKALAERLLAQYHHIHIHRRKDENADVGYEPLEALQAAIDETYAFRPDWARAELYSVLAESWHEYNGTARRIFVTDKVRLWDSWYVRTPAPEPEKKA